MKPSTQTKCNSTTISPIVWLSCWAVWMVLGLFTFSRWLNILTANRFTFSKLAISAFWYCHSNFRTFRSQIEKNRPFKQSWHSCFRFFSWFYQNCSGAFFLWVTSGLFLLHNLGSFSVSVCLLVFRHIGMHEISSFSGAKRVSDCPITVHSLPPHQTFFA